MTGGCRAAPVAKESRVFLAGGTGVVEKVVDRLDCQGRTLVALTPSEGLGRVLEQVGDDPAARAA